MIRFTPGGISRAELARQTDLSRAALSTIVGDLENMGLVLESDPGLTTGGRRPILLEINPQQGCVAGIDIGATHVGMVIADFSGHVMQESEYPFSIIEGPIACIPEVDSLFRSFLAQAGIQLHQIRAIGVGVPGPVIVEAGAVGAPPIMPGWDGYPIRKSLDHLWGLPVFLGNDAEFGALGEWAAGAGRGTQNLVYIKVGSGVGAGLFLDGNIYRGTTGCAGEIGHLTIMDSGPICTCGNRGCLEAVAGGWAIARQAREAVKSGKRTQLSSLVLEKITARDVATTARLGDLVAQQIVTEAGAHLGTAVASLVNLVNPSMVVVGGGVAQIGDLLLEPIRKAVRERSLRSAAQAVRINAAVLGRRSTSVGAAIQAISIALDQLVET